MRVHAAFMRLHQSIQTGNAPSLESIVDVSSPWVASPNLALTGPGQAVVCTTCELDIAWAPVQEGDHTYCCEGCATGGPCNCSYDDAQ
jgi:hypothetical protein